MLLLGCSPSSTAEVRGHALRAREHLEQGRPREAIAAFEKALAVEEQVPTLLAIAQIHAMLGEWDKAERYLERARTRAPLDPDVQLGLIDVALARGRNEDARLMAHALAKRLPMEPTPRLLLGALAETGEQAEAALHELTTWRSRAKGDLDMREVLVVEAALARTAGNLKDSRAHFERASSAPPGDANRCVRLARIFLKRDEWLPAQLLLDAAARKTLVARSLWMLLAGAAVEAGDYEAAQDALDNADRIKETAEAGAAAGPEVAVLRARAALGLGKTQQAHAALTAELARAQKSGEVVAPQVHYWIGRCLARLGRRDDARNAFEAIPKADPVYAAGQLALAELEFEAGEPEAAQARLEMLVSAPRSAPVMAYSLLARRQHEQKDDAAAESTIRKGLSHHARSAALWVDLAKLLQTIGRPQPAENALEQALAVNPFHMEALGMRASSAEKAGDVERARALYERLIDVRPAFVPALNNLALAYANEGVKLDTALQMAEQAHASVPDNALIKDTLAWVLYRRGDHERALKLLNEALATEPDHPQLLYHQGAVLAARGDSGAAKAALRKALQRSSDFAEAEQARALLAAQP